MTQPGAPTDAVESTKKRGHPVWRTILIILLVLLLGVVGVAAYVASNLQHSIDQSTDGKGGSVAQVFAPAEAPTPAAAASAAPAPAQAGRVNVLIAGNTEDDPAHPGAPMTDGIMVASIDTATHKVTLISVPRDIYVTYDGKPMKLNAVYYWGGGGVSGLKALGGKVTEITGLPITSHVRVSNKAFKDVVNAVGGVDVVIKTNDPRGIGDPNENVYLSSGPQHLDGDTAFRLASARGYPIPGKEAYGIPNSDFSREQNQQMILKAIATKVKTTPSLANPMAVVGLFDSVSANLRTDLTVANIKWLYEQEEAATDVKSVSLAGGLFDDYKVPAGVDIVDAIAPTAGVTDYSAVKAYIASQLK